MQFPHPSMLSAARKTTADDSLPAVATVYLSALSVACVVALTTGIICAAPTPPPDPYSEEHTTDQGTDAIPVLTVEERTSTRKVRKTIIAVSISHNNSSKIHTTCSPLSRPHIHSDDSTV